MTAQTKPGVATSKVTLDGYVEGVKGIKTDLWQKDLCARLEKAFWLARAPLFEFVEIDLGTGPAYVVAPSGFKIDRDEFEQKKGKGTRAAIHAPPQFGKPCYDGSMILLSNGTRKRLDDIEIGDEVITHKGRGRRVSAVHVQGDLECVEIVCNSGRRTIAALDHPFLTPEGWVEAGKLEPGQCVANVPEPECGGVSGREDSEFELLGYFMGDGACGPAGSSIHASVTSNDPEQAERFVAVGRTLGFECRTFKKQKTTALTYAFRGGVRDWLRDVGIGGCTSGMKRIPAWVYEGSNNQVALFLGAYFSCDGTLSMKGPDRHGNQRPDGVIEFYSISEGLLRDVQSLLLRVGVQSRVSLKNGRYNGTRHESWRLTVTSQDHVAQFGRIVPVPGIKGEKLRSLRAHRQSFRPQLLTDKVLSVRRVGKEPCRCLTVDDDHTFTVDDIVVHNSIIIAQCYPAWILGYDPTHRFRLATYNILHSARFSVVIKNILKSPEHLALFPHPAGHIPERCKAVEWSTYARQIVNDGQSSFTALGLQSGFVGTGADTLLEDDPYKPLAADTPIPTSDGWKQMGDLRVGDEVFDHAGLPCKVVRVTQRWTAPRHRVWFSDKTYVDTHPKHLWMAFRRSSHSVYTNKGRSAYDENWWQWKSRGEAAVEQVTTEEMADTLVARKTMRNWTIPTAFPLQLPDAALPIDPYVLGYWLGDGTARGATFTVEGEDVANFEAHVRAAGYIVRRDAVKPGTNTHTLAVSTVGERGNRWNDSLTKRLATLGLLQNKHIPDAYLRASAEQRLALLRGLMDSDGSASREFGEATFINTNMRLVRGVCELLASLGAKATQDKRAIGYAVRSFTPFQPFALSRKAERWRPVGQIRRVNRTVVKVEILEETEHLCIEVSSPSHLFLAGRGMIPTCNSAEEALSPVIRDKTWRFNTDTAFPRLDEGSNVFIMFHRYHQDDVGGRAIASGDFDMWRYAAEADGVYVDDETGRIFAEPIERDLREFLSPRKPAAYYERQKKNPGVWNSQFQGRPTSETGDFFNVTLLTEVDASEVPPLVHEVRAWDNASTEGAGAYTAGPRMGIDASGDVYISDVKRERVGTAERQALQETTAESDGKLVQIHAPQDPGSAGKDVAFQFRQSLGQKGYNVTTEPVSGSKEMRAYPLSLAVNSGKVKLVRGDWDIKAFKSELKNFPLSTYKDQVDGAADGYNHLYKLFHRGLVIKSFSPRVNLVPVSLFVKRFGQQVPRHWEVSAAVRFDPDASNPSGYAIVTRAAEDAGLGECVFVVASARRIVSEPGLLLDGLKSSLRRTCQGGIEQAGVTWLSRDSADITQVASEKHGLTLYPFEDDPGAGIPETNWYFQQREGVEHPFYKMMTASHLYLLVEDRQMEAPETELGQLSARQELINWAYNDQGEPQGYGGITLDCIRMTLYNFALSATAMTAEQRRLSRLPEDLKPAAVMARMGQSDFVENYVAQQHALNQMKIQDEKEDEKLRKQASRYGRPVTHRRYRKG